MNSQFKKGVLDIVVLSLLSDKDMYGYEIATDISVSVNISEGTVYPLLRRLGSDGLLDSYLEESGKGPPRKYYKLTDKGRCYLEKNRTLWFEFVDKVNEILRRNQ